MIWIAIPCVVILVVIGFVFDMVRAQGGGDCPVCRGHVDQRGICANCGDDFTAYLRSRHDR